MDPSKPNKSLPSVPRSTGCITCVSRKVRCDGRKPFCRGCEERKQRCQGYRRNQFTFLNEGWKPLGVASKTVTRVGSKSADEQEKHHAKPKARVVASVEPVRHGRRDDPSFTMSRLLVPDKTIIQITFFLSEFRMKISDRDSVAWFLGRLCRAFSLLSERNGLDQHNPLACATDAVVQAHFGRLNHDRTSTEQSIKAYGRSLRCVSQKVTDLTSKKNVHDSPEQDWDDLVCACFMMAVWEMTMYPTSTSWQNHVRAIAHTIEMWAPEKLRYTEMIMSYGMFILFERLSSTPGILDSPTQTNLFAGKIQNPLEFASRFKVEVPHMLSLYNIAIEYLASTTMIAQRYRQLLETWRSKRQQKSGDAVLLRCSLSRLHGEGEAVLVQIDGSLEICRKSMPEVPISTMADKLGGGTVPDYLEPLCRPHSDIEAVFDPATEFTDAHQQMLVSVLWTAAILLRLVVRETLSSIYALDSHFLENKGCQLLYHAALQSHREALLRHARSVLRAIPFTTAAANFNSSPFYYAPSVQLAQRAFAKECDMLRSEDAPAADLDACCMQKEIAERHLDWASTKKILIRVDFQIPPSIESGA